MNTNLRNLNFILSHWVRTQGFEWRINKINSSHLKHCLSTLAGLQNLCREFILKCKCISYIYRGPDSCSVFWGSASPVFVHAVLLEGSSLTHDDSRRNHQSWEAIMTRFSSQQWTVVMVPSRTGMTVAVGPGSPPLFIELSFSDIVMINASFV